jgi:hypothetical protein
VEDDDYRIHYTITSPAFRRLYFSAVEMNNTCKAAEIFGTNESYSVGRVVERELSVLNEGKQKWAGNGHFLLFRGRRRNSMAPPS